MIGLNIPGQIVLYCDTKKLHIISSVYGRMSWTGPSNMVELFHGSPFFNVFYNFLSTSTMPSTLTLVSICSLIYLLWNKKSPRSLGCIIRKLQYKIYRYIPGGGGGWGGGGWGAHRVTHKIVKKCVTLMLHNSKSIHARAAKLHTNKD